MSIIPSNVNGQASSFIHNKEHYLTLIKDLQARRKRAHLGGPDKARLRHTEGRGQILPRELMRLLLDVGSLFFALGALPGDNFSDGSNFVASIIPGAVVDNNR